MAELSGRDGAGINRQDIEKTLENILASEQFSGSPILVNFLSYIVTKTLDGEESEVKAYTIAVDALGHGDDFDPQNNAVVRVAAGRMRQALALYDASQSAMSDPVRISLEPGSYVPSFSIRDESLPENEQAPATPVDIDPDIDGAPVDAAAEPDAGPLIPAPVPAARRHAPWIWAILLGFGLALLAVYVGAYVFKTHATDNSRVANVNSETPKIAGTETDRALRPTIIATMLVPDGPYPAWFNPSETANSIGLVMSRFDDYRFDGIKMFEESVGDGRKADYQMLVSANRRGGTVRVFGRLIRENSGTVIWSAERWFSKPATPAGRNVPDIIGRLFAGVGSPYGVIYADLVRDPKPRPALKCIIQGYQYFSTESDEKHAAARNCAEALVEQGTKLPVVHALLTFLYLDEFREGRNRRDRDPVEAAQRSARRAIELGPRSARAHQAMFAVRKVQGDFKAARKAAEKALRLNPYDTDIMGDYAAWLISVGDNSKGREFITRVEGMLDARPAWLQFYRFLGAELASEFDTADDISRLLDMKRSPLVAVAVAIGAHRRDEMAKADRALSELVKTEPGFGADPKQQLLNRGFAPEIADTVVERLIAAGLKVKPEG